MAHKKRVTKVRNKAKSGGKSANTNAGRKRRKRLSLSASAETSKRPSVSMGDVLEYYKPIKKPVTLRLDADVLAWFRRDGRRYQTRINSALRSMMEREMRRS